MANFLFVLRDNDFEKATRYFQFTNIAHGKGHHVDLFFIDHGVDWTLKTRDGSKKKDTGDCVDDYLPYLVEHEVQVGVCTPCARNRKLD
jgi:sulfur relay (sulfurtransferase) complex TusBCD TusD component (DsrE family)